MSRVGDAVGEPFDLEVIFLGLALGWVLRDGLIVVSFLGEPFDLEVIFLGLALGWALGAGLFVFSEER